MLITVQMDENDSRFGLLINALRGITDGVGGSVSWPAATPASNAVGGTKLSPPAKPAEAPAPAAPAAPAVAQSPVFTEEDVANATRALATSKGIDIATGLLKEFEIEKARDLPSDKRETYIARAKELQAAK